MKIETIHYPAILQQQPEGGYTVTFPDFQEAVTEGDDCDEALANAQEVLAAVIAQRMADAEPIPQPSKVLMIATPATLSAVVRRF